MRRFLRRLLATFRSGRAEADLAREVSAHLQLLEDQFVARGFSAAEANVAARRAFGGQLEQMKEHQRDARSFRWLDESWLDLKLGVRMLVKYPGLTVIAVLALSVAIGGGAAYLEFVNEAIRPSLPVSEGHRIVGIVQWDVAAGTPERRSLHDFVAWRGQLRSIEHLGAYRPLQRNLMTDDGRVELVNGVEISASAFSVIGATPILGRPLTLEDEREGAPAVAVLGHALWLNRFTGDPTIVGRAIRLGGTPTTVVGVMPPDFGFPINHTLWVPLRVGRDPVPRGEGPRITMFGRLAPGFDLEAAQAELNTIAIGATSNAFNSNDHLRPRIKPYVESLWSSQQNGQLQVRVLFALNLFFVALLGVCGANVATLVFGRTITREAEITVRTALGASRRRIVAQLFAEALVLAAVAAVVGLAAASFGLRWGRANWLAGAANGATAPFWWDDRLSIETLLYGGVLALLAATMVGVVPALKATGSQLQERLKYAAAGGAGMKIGAVWSAVIVGQVALTVVFMLSVATLGWNVLAREYRGGDVKFAREQYLSARLEFDRDPLVPELRARPDSRLSDRSRSTYRELERRLSAEPGIGAITYATALPGMKHDELRVEFRDVLATTALEGPLRVQTASVAQNFFETFEAPMASGRGFNADDIELNRPVAIVDQTFARLVFEGRNPIGQWLRQPQDAWNEAAGPWVEIVGVVSDLSFAGARTTEDAVLYRPAAPDISPLQMAIRIKSDPGSLAPRLRSIAADVDPTLRLHDVIGLDRVNETDQMTSEFFLRVFVLVSAIALLLSTAGVYSLMAFSVARRTREIGIRTAVGANGRQLLTGIFSRVFLQVGAGIAVGSVPGGLLVIAGAPDLARASGFGVAMVAVVTVAAFMLAVAVLACIGPARRALAIQCTDALRAD